MRKPHQRYIILTLFLAASLILAACTRTASTEPTPITGAPPGEEAVVPDIEEGGVDATMEAVRSEILTESAPAEVEAEVADTPVPEEGAPTAQPVEPEQAEAEPTVAPEPPATSTPEVPAEHTVQQGEWIYSIARNFGLDPQAVIAANPGINPNLIQPGQVINLPQPGSPAVPPPAEVLPRPTDYTVEAGDWVYSIARKFGVTPEEIIAANPSLTPPYNIFAGQVLHIP